MKLPIKWLEKFVPTQEDTSQVADIFVGLGFEVESIENETIDLEVTPNRGDCLSIYGLAREYAAKQLLPLEPITPVDQGIYLTKPKKVKISLPSSGVERFAGIIIELEKINSSSDDVTELLAAVDHSTIDSVVDATNFVMHELGQPLHAFDLNKLSGQELNLHFANDSNQLTTLDGQSIQPTPECLVASDAKEIVDLVGIQGGVTSTIDKGSRGILLQAAIFDPKIIRRAAKLTGKSTEASARYERGIDWEMCLPALEQTAQMICRKCNGKIVERFDIQLRRPKSITLDLEIDQLNQKLGTKLETKTAVDALERLGFTAENNHYNIPSWRIFDIHFSEDLIEEVARIIGYDNLPKTVLSPTAENIPIKTYQQTLSLKIQLAKAGFSECQTYSFISDQDARAIGQQNLLGPSNPLSQLYRYLRPALLWNILKVFSQNSWYDNAQVFEIGHVFSQKEDAQETENIVIAWTGKISLPAQLDNFEVQTIDTNHPFAQKIKLRQKVNYIETKLKNVLDKYIDLATAVKNLTLNPYQPISKYPPYIRDVAVIVDQATNPGQIADEVKKLDDKIILFELFDEFTSPKLGEGKKSLAFHIIIDDLDKTPTKEEGSAIVNKIHDYLKTQYQAVIR